MHHRRHAIAPRTPTGSRFTDFLQGGQPPSDFDENSPEYTVSQFPFLTFDIAIDVNTNSAASETLDSFTVFVDGAEIYTFTARGSQTSAVTPRAPATALPTGYCNRWTSRRSRATRSCEFNAVWSGDVAGAESFFLVQVDTPPPVAEPGTLILMGLGLVGLGLLQRRRNSRS